MSALIGGGLRGVRREWRAVLALYSVHLGFAAVFTWVVYRTLSSLYGVRPLFAQAVDGDVAALILALRQHEDAMTPLIWIGVALVAVYGLASFYLTAGLIGRLRGEPFAAAASRRAFAFFRLWLWALIPSAITLGAAFQGMSMVVEAHDGPLGASAHPLAIAMGGLGGLLAYGFVALSVDLARVLLVADDKLGAGRAFLRGIRRAFGWPAAQFLLYGVLWWGVGLIYARGMLDVAASVVVLFVLRQLVVITRFLLRCVTTAGQVAWIDAQYMPSKQAVSSTGGAEIAGTT